MGITTASRTLVLLLVGLAIPSVCQAKIRSGKCGECHTMHNSQGGVALVTTTGAPLSGGGPLPSLLLKDCVGCHTGTNNGTNKIPYVLDPISANYGSSLTVNGTSTGYTGTGTGTETNSNTLAGGNFYWVSNYDRVGHNVLGIAEPDQTLTTAPGGTMTTQLRCAGTYGCHGDRTKSDQTQAMAHGHHGGTNSSVWLNGSTSSGDTAWPLTSSYRLLMGIQGLEDSNWEYHPDSSHHNVYYGVDRSSFTSEVTTGSISSLCAKCHGTFHYGSNQVASDTTNVWVRHPTDYDMSHAKSSGEYIYYNGGSGTLSNYSVISPVATSDNLTAPNATVTPNGGTDDTIVMCLSCHRAHGTPYTSILRWDYKDWPGGGYNGCAVCHTTKD